MSTLQNAIPAGSAYGIESLQSAIAAANAWYDLFAAVYLDDKKFGADDWVDLIGLGPAAAQKTITAANNAKNFDKEILDLDDAEIEQLESLAGERLKDDRYQDILHGALYIVKGVSGFRSMA